MIYMPAQFVASRQRAMADLITRGDIMAKTANIYTRVDPEIKDRAESILEQLGIPMSNAIGIFLRQVIMHNGLPFEMTLNAPKAAGSLTKEQLDAELQKGFDDVSAGRMISADEIEAEMKRRYGL